MRSGCQYNAKPMSRRMRSRCQGECEADVKVTAKPMSRRCWENLHHVLTIAPTSQRRSMPRDDGPCGERGIFRALEHQCCHSVVSIILVQRVRSAPYHFGSRIKLKTGGRRIGCSHHHFNDFNLERVPLASSGWQVRALHSRKPYIS